MPDSFEDYRPFTDAEIPQAMRRITNDPAFAIVAAYIWPDKRLEEAQAYVCGFQTIDDFQHHVMYDACSQILKRSIRSLSWSGVPYLSPEQGYLFVSNHRDIVLDSLLLQYVLYCNNLPTTEITFGDNLMMSDFIVDCGRANKMFKVVRKSSNMHAFLHHSKLLSEYIRSRIAAHTSVWIAQRNGRTKNGFDNTDQGLVNMFGLSGSNDLAASAAELHIVPIAISYEYEPCDLMKLHEVYLTMGGQPYTKTPGEDLQSILTGIEQPKGDVHLALCEPVTAQDLEPFRGMKHQDFNRSLSGLIDQRIHAAYHCHATQYIACDLLDGTRNYRDYYTTEQMQRFQERLDEAIASLPQADPQVVRRIFLEIYAGALIQQQRL